jgi:hypothetical protein
MMKRSVLSASLVLLSAAESLAQNPGGPVITSTNLNPRVGQTATVSVGWQRNGNTDASVSCQVEQANGASVSVTPNGAIASVEALRVGYQDVFARCGTARTSIRFHVRPRLVHLTIRKEGLGNGSLFANPFLSAGYDEGTVVTIRARALRGSDFIRWAGSRCNGGSHRVGRDDGTCVITMDRDHTVIGRFAQEGKDAERERADADRLDGRTTTATGATASRPSAGPGKALGIIAGAAAVGAGAYGLGVYLANQSGTVSSGSCYSSRTCSISVFTGACVNCVGTLNAGCDFSGTPAEAGESCVSGTPCKAGLICVNSRCEAPGRCQ